MKTEVEKGLASHSSNMVAPRDCHREPEDGWTVVMSKKNLRKTRKNKKNDFKKFFDASSVVHILPITTRVMKCLTSFLYSFVGINEGTIFWLVSKQKNPVLKKRFTIVNHTWVPKI